MALLTPKNVYLLRFLAANSPKYTLAHIDAAINRHYTTVSSKKGQSFSLSNINDLTPPPKPKLDLTFEDSKTAFKAKSTLELLRGYLVFQLCSIGFIIENQKTVSYLLTQ